MPIDAIQQIATSAARIAPGVEGRVSAGAQAQAAQAFTHVADAASATLAQTTELEEMHPDPRDERRREGSGHTGTRARQGHDAPAEERPHEDGVGERIDLIA